MVVSGPVVSGCRKDKGSPYDTNLPSVDPQNLHLPLESWGFRIPTLSVDVSMFFGNKPTEDILFPGFGFKSRPKWHQEEFQSESNGNLIPNTPNLTRKLFIMILPSLKLTAILLPKGSSSRWWFQIFLIFTPSWGNDPIRHNLTNIFQMGGSPTN